MRSYRVIYGSSIFTIGFYSSVEVNLSLYYGGVGRYDDSDVIEDPLLNFHVSHHLHSSGIYFNK